MNAPDHRVRVKVCGITRPGDAEALDALNIDYLGFNFHPGSRRFVDPRAAAKMISRLTVSEPVGVFVNASPEYITHIAEMTGIRWVQLHGQEGWNVLERISLPVIKAIPNTRLNDYGGLQAEWDCRSKGHPHYFLVDTNFKGEFGGTGHVFDWSLLKFNSLPRPFFLAGGLGPQNLESARADTRPFAVDLNSKVETAPGIKDLELVKLCLEILKGHPS